MRQAILGEEALQGLTDIAYRLQHLIGLRDLEVRVPRRHVATGPEDKAQRVGIYYRTLGSSGAKAKDHHQAALYLSLKGKRRHLDPLIPL
jgi:hypothetical protein